MKQPEERLRQLEQLAHELNARMPTDVMLKGDGAIWATAHGNDAVQPRPITQQAVLELLYAAKRFGEKMVSV